MVSILYLAIYWFYEEDDCDGVLENIKEFLFNDTTIDESTYTLWLENVVTLEIVIKAHHCHKLRN